VLQVATVELAPQYTRTERIRFVAIGVTVGGLLVLAHKLWFFPWLRDFSAIAHCSTLFGLGGTAVLLRGLFVALPVLVAALVVLSVGRRGYKIVRQGRTPPEGEKVFRPTPIIRGARAKFLGYIQLFAAVPLLMLAVWGFFQAESLLAQSGWTHAKEAPDPSVKGTSCGKPQAAPYVER